MNHTGQHRRAAFSLLEVMLAVTLLALVVTAVAATWNAALRGWKRSSGLADSLQRERVLMNTLGELVQAVVFYRSEGGLYDMVGQSNDRTGDSISFVTASDVLLPPADALAGAMRRVTISLEQDEAHRYYLAIRNQPALGVTDTAEPVPPRILSADVSGFKVRYFHPRTKVWQDNWEEKNLIPAVVEFTLTIGGDDPRVPATVATRTMTLPTAEYVAQTGGAPPGEQMQHQAVPRGGQSAGGNGGMPVITGVGIK